MDDPAVKLIGYMIVGFIVLVVTVTLGVLAWRVFLFLLPYLLVLGALVGLFIGGKSLYAHQQQQRAELHHRQAEAFAPFLQTLCQTYGRYDECTEHLDDWYAEHRAFIHRLAVFCRRTTTRWIDPHTPLLTVMKQVSVDTDTLAAIPDKDRTAFLEILRNEATNGTLRGLLPATDDLSTHLRTTEWRDRLTQYQYDLDRRVFERIAREQVVIGFPTNAPSILPKPRHDILATSSDVSRLDFPGEKPCWCEGLSMAYNATVYYMM